MRVQTITTTNFESKPRPMTQNMRDCIQSILYRMNLDTVRKTKGDYIETSMVTKLIDENSVFTDERRFKEIHPFREQMKGYSSLKIGKSWLDFDNEAFEIMDYKKPFYKPWFMFAKEVEKQLDKFRTDLSNIKTEILSIRDLTPEGNKKMKKFVLEFEKKRLEAVIKDLEKCD